VAASQAGSAFVARRTRDLDLIFALQFQRTVNRDNAVSFQNLSLQIEAVRSHLHLLRTKVGAVYGNKFVLARQRAAVSSPAGQIPAKSECVRWLVVFALCEILRAAIVEPKNLIV
jgi:hypothetical protein